MATTELVTLTDDLDNSVTEGVQTVAFFHPETGEKLELELGEKNAKALSKAITGLEKFINVARVVEVAKPTKAAGRKNDLTAVREWAKANGFAVGDRGRIKAEILEAYDAAQMPTVVADDKVVLTVSPEAQDKLEEIAAEKAERQELTDQDILAMMAEIDAEKGSVELADLAAKVDNGSDEQ
jgi:hypothetical protein